MIRGLLGVALGWCLIVGANAQPLADVATDQELFAAYCLGAIIASQGDGSLSEIETLLGRDFAQQTKERYGRKRSRFLGYLTARGLLSGSRSISAMTGARLATERGRAHGWQQNEDGLTRRAAPRKSLYASRNMHRHALTFKKTSTIAATKKTSAAHPPDVMTMTGCRSSRTQSAG